MSTGLEERGGSEVMAPRSELLIDSLRAQQVQDEQLTHHRTAINGVSAGCLLGMKPHNKLEEPLR